MIGTERPIAQYGNSVRRCEYDYAAAIVCEDFEWVWMPAVVRDGGYAFPHSDGLVCDTCQTDSIQQWGYALLGLRVSLDEISLNPIKLVAVEKAKTCQWIMDPGSGHRICTYINSLAMILR